MEVGLSIFFFSSYTHLFKIFGDYLFDAKHYARFLGCNGT